MEENVSCQTSVPSVGCQSPLSELYHRYRWYAVNVRAVSEETVKQRLLYIRRAADFFGPPDSVGELFEALGSDSISDLLIDYAARHGQGSQRNMQRVLRSFLHFAYLDSYISRDLSELVPSARIPKNGQLPSILPAECISALREGIGGDTCAALRDSAIVSLLSIYGVRGVQVRRLCLDHIDWHSNRIHFPAAKDGNEIEQHLTREAGNRLTDYITQARPHSICPEVFLTLSEPVQPLRSSSQLSAILRRRMKELGIKPPEGVSHGCHGFRHAFASRMVGRVPFKDLADLLGHRDPSSTLVYSKMDLQTLNQAAVPWPGGER